MSGINTESIALCIDVGGTKLDYRFVRLGKKSSPLAQGRILCAPLPSFIAALKMVLGEMEQPVSTVCIAAAGPVRDGRISFTNLDWIVDPQEILARFGFEKCLIINDLTAVTWSLQGSGGGDHLHIKGGRKADGVQLVVAPGTGLGVGFAIPHPGGFTCLASEGGHVSYSPRTEQERQLLAFLSPQDQPISAESVCSGLGLGTLFRFLTRQDPSSENLPYEALGPWLGQQVDEGLRYKEAALATYTLFFDHLAEVCGNLAVTCLPVGGVYLAGGLMTKLMPFMDQNRFIGRFLNRSVQEDLLAEIPIYLLQDDNPALVGCEAMLREQT